MKNLMTKTLCALLMLAMLVPMMSFMTSAAEITNLYDFSKTGVGTPPAKRDDAVVSSLNFYTTHPIEVKAGDVVTFGPVVNTQPYYFTTYDADGNTVRRRHRQQNFKRLNGVFVERFKININIRGITRMNGDGFHAALSAPLQTLFLHFKHGGTQFRNRTIQILIRTENRMGICKFQSGSGNFLFVLFQQFRRIFCSKQIIEVIV